MRSAWWEARDSRICVALRREMISSSGRNEQKMELIVSKKRSCTTTANNYLTIHIYTLPNVKYHLLILLTPSATSTTLR